MQLRLPGRANQFNAASRDQFRFSTAIGLGVRSGTIWQGGLLFIDPTKNPGKTEERMAAGLAQNSSTVHQRLTGTM
jgi:hypothetical protein